MDVTFVHRHHGLEVEAHEANCADIARLAKKPDVAVLDTCFYEDRAQVFFDYNSDFYAEAGKDGCYHIAFKPCTNALPNGIWPDEFGIK